MGSRRNKILNNYPPLKKKKKEKRKENFNATCIYKNYEIVRYPCNANFYI